MVRFHALLLATSALFPLGLMPAAANPLGAQVVGGSATVQGQGSATVTVTQQTNSAIINWNTFNIGVGDRTNIVMPSSSSVQLDRVSGGLGPSQILGSLWSNGRVFLVNPDGILFGSGSTVNAAGFLATTHDIANADFMSGKYNFTMPGNPTASVVNLGTITASNAGFAALVAPGVRNAGTITATLGTVGLASSGNGFSLDFYGDKLLTLNVNDQIAATVKDVSTGQPLNSLVNNTGKLSANGGRVELTAAAARQVVDSVINNTGVVEANSIGTKNGMIVLSAATNASKPAGAAKQTVKVSGTLSAAGKNTGETGGKVQITGEAIELSGANIDASGTAAGGKVLIGGDIGGGHPNPLAASFIQAGRESYALPTATTTNIDALTAITASALSAGNGGKVVVWADDATNFYGSILARGGSVAGNGGFVEISGHQTLGFYGTTDTHAPAGQSGLTLLDPANFTINSDNVGSVQTSLASGNFLISTVGTLGAAPGDIFVNTAVNWSNTSTLTLQSAHDISINGAISAPNGGLIVNALNAITATGPINLASFELQNGAWSQIAGSLPSFAATDFRITGGTFLRALGGDGSAASPYQIADVYGLQGIGSPSNALLNKDFVLANDVDASGTANWNSGAGFVPIGAGLGNSFAFSGKFDGQGSSVDNLSIAQTASFSFLGLFGLIAGGSVKNLNLNNVSIQANLNMATGWQNVGALAGSVGGGLIDHVTASGTINGGTVVGGLVGQLGFLLFPNSVVGTIQNSSSAVNITLGNGLPCSDASCSNGRVNLAGGLVGDNGGAVITGSSASGAIVVGASATAGGLVGESVINSFYNTANQPTHFVPLINSSFASGNVSSTGTNATLGGLVGGNAGNITASYATGNVTAGVASIAGGLSGVSFGALTNTYATGAVNGGGNSILGGLIGLSAEIGLPDVANMTIGSRAYGPVSSSGPNSWVGGFIGANAGTINSSSAFGPVTGTSDSLVGGFSGLNLGVVIDSTTATTSSVTANGPNNFIGGFVGANFGLIDPSTAAGSVTGGANNVVGGFAGTNASLANLAAGLIPGSTLPVGTVSADSFATGSVTGGGNSTVGAQIGTTNPSALPANPSIVATCGTGVLCSILDGLVLLSSSSTSPATELVLPPPITQINPPINNTVASSGAVLASLTPSTLAGTTPPGAGPPSNPTPGKPGFIPPPLPARSIPGPNGETRSSVPPPGEIRFFQNQVLLQLDLNIPDAELTRIAQQLGLRIITSDTLSMLGRKAIRLQLPPGMSVRDAILRLEANRLVSVAAPVYQFRLSQPAGIASKGDPAQYMLGTLHMDQAHAVASGKGVTIALIDSAVDKRHTELQGAISEEFDTLGATGPLVSHGTEMAGAMVSRARLLGVAPSSKILVVSAFGQSNNTAEGTTLSILQGIDWAISKGARVINMSFAGPRDPSLERALKAAHEKGVVLVAAAGNAGPNSPPLYPGADPHVIAVTATDFRDQHFRFANQGPQLSVAAPGVDILAPSPQESYRMSTGTSIATAHVSGVVALMLERDSTLKPDEVRKILESTATDLGPKGKDSQFGWGLVNPSKALEAVAARLKSSDASSKGR